MLPYGCKMKLQQHYVLVPEGRISYPPEGLTATQNCPGEQCSPLHLYHPLKHCLRWSRQR